MSNAKQVQQSQSDDIDNLLDQVEKRFLKSPEARKLAETLPKDCECTKKQPTNWEEVDEILKDFAFEDTNPFGKHKNNSWIRKDFSSSSSSSSKAGPNSNSQDENRKCNTVLLAGSYEPMGHSEMGKERSGRSF